MNKNKWNMGKRKYTGMHFLKNALGKVAIKLIILEKWLLLLASV